MPLTQVNPGLLDTQAQYTGFKNRIINGAMGIWQRGTSSTINGGYGSADRWYQAYSTSGTFSQSTDVPSGFKYSLSVAGSNFPQLQHRIESVNCTDLVGQSVTISLWIKQTVGAGSGSIGLALQYANAADNFSAITAIGSTTLITATSSWVQYTATFTSLPSGAANGLQVQIYGNTAGSSTYLVTGVQLEKGSTATSFDYRPYGTELALCQRYLPYWSWTTAYSVLGVGMAYASTAAYAYVAYQVPPRVIPTGLVSSGTYRTINSVYGLGGVGTLTIGNNYSSSAYFTLFLNGTSGLTAGNATFIVGDTGGGYIYATGCEL